jgi:hypothetical protein
VKTACRFDDVVFQGIHHFIKPGRSDAPVEYSSPFDFPYRQLLPQNIDGLIVTGRACIVQPPVMRIRWMVFLMGQAAGSAAALAVRSAQQPRDIDIKALQKVLHEKYGMPLGDANRLKELGLAQS